MLRLREQGVRAGEIDALQQSVKGKKAKKGGNHRQGTLTASGEDNNYEATEAGIVWMKQTVDGEVAVRLTNFSAFIKSQIIQDNGVETSVSFGIAAQLGERVFEVSVAAAEFASLAWVLENLGPQAIVFPGAAIRDRVRVAIQLLSTDVATRRIYAHSGWRKVDDRWVFLHATGAIGPMGPEDGIEVSLDDQLRDVVLPPPPTGDDLRAAFQAILRLIELGKPEIVLVGMAAVFRSVLGEACPVDFTLHLAGQTGVFKSELAALLQGFFGSNFNGRRLPGSFKSTANANERLLSAGKDIIIVIDDFAPTGTSTDVARLHREADSLLRGVGNRSGRARLRADGTPRPVYVPRGLPITTGEDVPAGHSLRARTLILEVEQGDIDLARLTSCQCDRDSGLYVQVMAKLLEWLARKMDGLKATLRTRQETLRQEFLRGGSHRRVPDIAGSLLVGFEVFLEFAKEVCGLSAAEAKGLETKAREALAKAAASQAELQGSEEPASRFLSLLVAALASGRAHLGKVDTGEAPRDAERWGWRKREVGTGKYVREELNPQGACVGWIEGIDVLLDPESSFAAAQRLAAEQGTSLPVTARTLWKRLSERGYLASRDLARGKNLVRRMVVGKRRDVIHLTLRTLSDTPSTISGPIGPIGPGASQDKDSGRQFVGPAPDPAKSEAPSSGPELWEDGPIGPIGPEAEGTGPMEEGTI